LRSKENKIELMSKGDCVYCAVTRASSRDESVETKNVVVPRLDMKRVMVFRAESDDLFKGLWQEIKLLIRFIIEKIGKSKPPRNLITGGPFLCSCSLERARNI
jgi:hypothetical protein